MVSITKNKQSYETIEKMVKRAFIDLTLKQVKELKEGCFNVAYLIELSNHTEVILKIAPPKDSFIMTHEKNIMFSEVKSMQRIANETEVPVAEILFYDNSHSLCDSDYFFMSKLSGQSFQALMGGLSEEDKRQINFNTGRYNAIINKITGEKFGYYGQEDRQGANWFQVFMSMIKDAINDANALEIDLQTAPELIINLLERDKPYFDEVVIPRFVHWDLWAGNIFVNNNIISGLIDFERCLWADELMEVGFRTYGYSEEFFQGYGIEQLSEKQKVRAKWYDIYLFLIAALECDYRHYENRDTYQWSTHMIKEWITKIK